MFDFQFIATFVVGSVFLASGWIKAINAKQFIRHNLRYGLSSPKFVKLASIAFIALESAIAIALIFQEFLQWLIPLTIALLICLSVLTIWSTSSGRAIDCGCYGGIVLVSPLQSVLLNVGYISLLVLAGLNLSAVSPAIWQYVLTLIVFIVSGVLAVRSRNQPLIDFSRLKPGKRWKSSWLENTEFDLQQGNYFLAFISPSCHYCHQWITQLNRANSQISTLQILGILAIEQGRIAEFKKSKNIDFPLVTMNALLFNYTIEGVPTGVILEDGIIVSRWNGNLPPQLSSTASTQLK